MYLEQRNVIVVRDDICSGEDQLAINHKFRSLPYRCTADVEWLV